MGKKRKGGQDDGSQAEFWCFYCDQTMANEEAVVSHQINKHFRCPECPLNIPPYKSAHGLLIHYRKTHGPVLEKIPNSIEGRGDPTLDVRGMSGIPEHLQRTAPAERQAPLYTDSGIALSEVAVTSAQIEARALAAEIAAREIVKKQQAESLLLQVQKQMKDQAAAQNDPEELRKRVAEYAARNNVHIPSPSPAPQVPTSPMAFAAPKQMQPAAGGTGSTSAKVAQLQQQIAALAQQMQPRPVVSASASASASTSAGAMAAAIAEAAAAAAIARQSAASVSLARSSQGAGVSSADVSRIRAQQQRLKDLANRRARAELVVTVTEREKSNLDAGCLRAYLESFGAVVAEGSSMELGKRVWKWRFADGACAASARALATHLVPNGKGKEVKVDIV